MSVENSPLLKKTAYISTYTPSLIFPIARKESRIPLNIVSSLPFSGEDIWNGYELSWLDKLGKPQLATAEFRFDCKSEFIIESKSFKLYLNSLHHTQFSSIEEVQNTIQKDLEANAKGKVQVTLNPKAHEEISIPPRFFCLDDLPITIDTYSINPKFLTTSPETSTEEFLYTNLFMSNCPVTSQPDWATVFLIYKGPKIDPEGLLKYFVSYRKHNGFGEETVERIFMDVSQYCKPDYLTVYSRFTRRGGLDINPFRTNNPDGDSAKNFRLIRQ